MKLVYPVSLKDFAALQVPFTTQPGKNAGFKAALLACALIAALGIFCIIEGLGIPVGAFLIGLAMLAAAAAYAYDKLSVSKARQKHEHNLAAGYQKIHCRGKRIFEAGPSGYTFSCECGTTTRPWSELTQLSENENFFAVGTRAGTQILPKSAFASPAEVTEFRALVAGKLNQSKPLTSRHVDFALTGHDRRSARLLHLREGGGWRLWLKFVLTYACIAWGCVVIWKYISPSRNLTLLAVMIGVLVAAPVLKILVRRRARYFGQLRIYFSEEGLHLQDPVNQARTPWSRFIGYLEDSNVLLLYYNPQIYRIIPKRVLTGPAEEFRTLVAVKIPRFDYRNPHPEVKALSATAS